MLISINPDEDKFNIFKAINEIHRHIKASTEKSLIDKISERLLELEFVSNHSAITLTLKSCQKSIAIIIKHGSKHKKARLIVLVIKILHTILKKTKK